MKLIKKFEEFVECGTGDKFAPYEVQNSTASGAFDILSGTAYSVNTYFVGLEEQLGLCDPPEIAKAAGVQQGNGEDFEKYPCFTLGCFDVTTLDMAVGMATFAAHGVRCNAIAITEVKDRYGKNLNVPSADCQRTIDLQVADSTTAVLAGVIDGPVKGRTGQAMDLGRPAAGKTGTTDSSAAVWFVGYTPDMAAAVWVGDPRGGQKYPMKGVTINGRYYSQVFGSTMPGPIWRDSLIGALEGTPETAWDLNTLNGVNAGGHGNEITATKDKCAGLEDEELIECNSASALKKYAAELAAGTYVLDPLTGQIIDVLTGQVIAETAAPASPSAAPSPSATSTKTP